ncbi:MAG: O-antigen ligase family protein [Mariprofundaceae bacterium]
MISLLLSAAYLIAPDSVQLAIGICGALMVILVAFTSVELTLYLLILSTLLSPELQFGGGSPEGGTNASRGVTLRVDDLLLTLICLTWIFRMAIFKQLGSIRQTPLNQPIAWYWLAALIATIAGFYSGRVGMYGFFFVVKYLEYFVIFYMIINQIHDKESIQRYINIMLFTCVAACLLGIAQIPSGERVSAPFEGEIGEPNTFGGYLVLMFSVALGMFLNMPVGKKRNIMMGILLIILVPFAFTESRSSYLAFVVAMGMFIIYSEHRRLLMMLGLIGLVMMPIVLPGNVINRILFTFYQPPEAGQIKVGGMNIDTSTSERLRSWQTVLSNDLPKHPLLGVGVTGGRFMDAQYPRVLSETGLIGLALFLWLLRRIWVILKRGYHEVENPELKGAALGVLCGYGGLLVHAVGSNTFIIVRIMEPFMIFVGLITAAVIIQKNQDSDLQDLSITEKPTL